MGGGQGRIQFFKRGGRIPNKTEGGAPSETCKRGGAGGRSNRNFLALRVSS